MLWCLYLFYHTGLKSNDENMSVDSQKFRPTAYHFASWSADFLYRLQRLKRVDFSIVRLVSNVWRLKRLN